MSDLTVVIILIAGAAIAGSALWFIGWMVHTMVSSRHQHTEQEQLCAYCRTELSPELEERSCYDCDRPVKLLNHREKISELSEDISWSHKEIARLKQTQQENWNYYNF